MGAWVKYKYLEVGVKSAPVREHTLTPLLVNTVFCGEASRVTWLLFLRPNNKIPTFMAPAPRVVYVRAIVFEVLLACACLTMLFLSALEAFRPFRYFWLTVAVGTLAIVVYTGVSVYRYRDALPSGATVTSTTVQPCPDFWQRSNYEGDDSCANKIDSQDGRYTFVIGAYPNPMRPLKGRQESIMTGLNAPACAAVNQAYPYEYMKNLCRTQNLPTATA
jgi:hypothetical protein